MVSNSLPPSGPLRRQNSPSQPTATSLMPSPLRSAMTGDEISWLGVAVPMGLTSQSKDPLPRNAYVWAAPLGQLLEQLLITTSGAPSPLMSPMAGETSEGL